MLKQKRTNFSTFSSAVPVREIKSGQPMNNNHKVVLEDSVVRENDNYHDVSGSKKVPLPVAVDEATSVSKPISPPVKTRRARKTSGEEDSTPSQSSSIYRR